MLRSPNVLGKLADGVTLSLAEMRAAMTAILAKEWGDIEVASFLTALRVRQESIDELVGAAEAIKSQAVPFSFTRPGLLDTCGTGGDGLETFNVSTATAIVAAACGIPVAKHGNRNFSSKSGSADVLAELGVNTLAEPAAVARCLEDVGIAFFFAPRWHPAVGQVQTVRRQLGFRTIFNLLGPLCNPARAEYQIIGVGLRNGALERMAAAAQRLGAKSALVVQGLDGLDEVTLAAPTRVIRVTPDALHAEQWTPATFGLPTYSTQDWRVESPQESAEVIRGVLEGRRGPARDLVLANAAAATFVAGAVDDLKEGVRQAAAALDSGAAAAKLAELVRWSHAP